MSRAQMHAEITQLQHAAEEAAERAGIDLSTPSPAERQALLAKLAQPFHPSRVTWKPGAVKGNRALALAYADLRAYMDRLDEVCGGQWSVAYQPWGENRLICKLTIMGITRSSTGESSTESEKSEIGGTVAEAQAFKRACAMFGLGRYLYTLPSGWADYDPVTRKFTDRARAKLTGLLVQHYRRSGADATPHPDLDDRTELFAEYTRLGEELYGHKWEEVSRRNVHRITAGATRESSDLSADQLQQLITGLHTLKSKREAVAA